MLSIGERLGGMARTPDMADVFVAGGGPAGLAVAIAARQKGFEVIVADYQQPPIDKACGEGLMPEGVEALRRLGVRIPPSVAHAFHGIRFIDGNHCFDARFPSGHGVALRRTALHSLLLDRATELGVEFRWRTRVTALASGGVIAGGNLIQAKWIVGADGSASMIRRLAGLDRRVFNSRRFGFRRHFRIVPWSDFTEVYWGKICQAYITPVGPREVCVAVLSRDPRLRINQILAQFPELVSQLRGAEATSIEKGAVSENHVLWRIYRGRVLLAGDASGTGDGLSISFRQALAISSALEAGNLSSYAAAHRRLAMEPLLMSCMLLSLDKYSWLRERAFQALASQPRIFAGMLALHSESSVAPALSAGGRCRSAWECGLNRPERVLTLSGCVRSFRRGLGRRCFLALALLAAILFATPSRAQDNYEIQVYGSELVDPGHTMFELHSNFTIDGSRTVVDGVYPTNHAEHETLEITHGFTDYFECGFYIFSSITEGQGWQWVGDPHPAALCHAAKMALARRSQHFK